MRGAWGIKLSYEGMHGVKLRMDGSRCLSCMCIAYRNDLLRKPYARPCWSRRSDPVVSCHVISCFTIED